MPPALRCIDASLSECESCQTLYLTNSPSSPTCMKCNQETHWNEPPPPHPTYAIKNSPGKVVELTPLLHQHRYATLPADISLLLGFVEFALVPYSAWKNGGKGDWTWTSVVLVMGPHFLHFLAVEYPHDMRHDLDISTMILVGYPLSLRRFGLLPLDASMVTVIATTNAYGRNEWESHFSKHCHVPPLDDHLNQLQLPSTNSGTNLTFQFPSRGIYHAELMDHLNTAIDQEEPFASLISTLQEVYPELISGRCYPVKSTSSTI